MTHFIASLERSISKTARYVAEGGERYTFREAAEEICRHYRNALVTDAVHYEKRTTAEVLRVLKVCLVMGGDVCLCACECGCVWVRVG